MRIGIIVYSQTGNTLQVAERLRDQFDAIGRSVALSRISIAGDTYEGKGPIDFSNAPSVEGYDKIVFAAPVNAFSLCPVMKEYLGQINHIEGVQSGFLVTQFFSQPWLGGNRAVRQMTRLAEKKGAEISEAMIVNWKSRKREQLIVEGIERLVGALR